MYKYFCILFIKQLRKNVFSEFKSHRDQFKKSFRFSHYCMIVSWHYSCLVNFSSVFQLKKLEHSKRKSFLVEIACVIYSTTILNCKKSLMSIKVVPISAPRITSGPREKLKWSSSPYTHQYFGLRGASKCFKWSAHQKSLGTTGL